uniref:LITAF domain-containing protein n=1 Tax=Meloidogyne incognita TaxID=6306 RepID=A0A914L8E1_MELIC
MGNNYSHNYGYNPFMPYSPNYGGYTLPAQFYGPDPQLVHCPKCNQNTTTEVKFVFGGCTWFYAVFFIAFGSFMALAGAFACSIKDDECFIFIPFAIILFSCVPCVIFCNCFKNAEHRCSRCDTFIGKYERFSGRPAIVLPPECHKHQMMPNYHK